MNRQDKTVLIIEDDPEVLEPLADLLTIEGYDVVTADHPGLGASRAPYADCIILDLQLTPNNQLEGGDILSHVWKDGWCDTPVIIFSGLVGAVELYDILDRIETVCGKGRNIFRCIPKMEGVDSVITAVNECFDTTFRSD